jgi:hypothetical protein
LNHPIVKDNFSFWYSPEGCENPEKFIAFSMQLFLLYYAIKPQNETEMSNGTKGMP